MRNLFIIIFFLASKLLTCAQSEAIVSLKRAAENGDIKAQLFLGRAYTEGLYGVNKSPQQAYNWYLEAAKQGDAKAQYEVAILTLQLKTNQEGATESIQWMEKSANCRYAPAEYELGNYLRRKKGYEHKAFLYYKDAAEQGFAPACYDLANCYTIGVGTEVNADEAIKYFQKSLNTGNMVALLGIAECYEHLKKDDANAFAWYQKAVDTGMPQAYNDIAYMYAKGKGVNLDFNKAHEMVDVAILKCPDISDFYDSKGEIYLMEGKTDKAKEMWKKVLAIDPDAAKRTTPLAMAMNNSVDYNIPQTSFYADKTFVMVCANEDYKRVAPVPYAKNDGKVFTEYCLKAMGIPEKNIYYVENATLGDMKYNINLLKKIANAYNGEAKIIFYYAGHGIPDESQKDGYLLPVDGYGNDATSGYSLKALYSELANIPSKSVLVFMDACFSGAQRDGNMLESARGVAIKPKTETPTGNLVVFSAASGDETAHPYKEHNHGLFTYFLLKKLQESKGDVTLGELGDYLITNVSQESISINKKNQTPTITPSQSFLNNWRNIKLK